MRETRQTRTRSYHLCAHVCAPEQADSSLFRHGSSRGPWSGACWGSTCQIGGAARRCRGRLEAIGSAGSWEGRRQRPGQLHSGGRQERTSGAGEGTKSAAVQRNPSGRKGSGGGEEWGCAGGVEEMETCRDSGRLFNSIY